MKERRYGVTDTLNVKRHFIASDLIQQLRTTEPSVYCEARKIYSVIIQDGFTSDRDDMVVISMIDLKPSTHLNTSYFIYYWHRTRLYHLFISMWEPLLVLLLHIKKQFVNIRYSKWWCLWRVLHTMPTQLAGFDQHLLYGFRNHSSPAFAYFIATTRSL